MRKILKSSVLILFACIMTNCTKNNDQVVKPTLEISIKLITEVENLPKSSVALGYNTLNSAEKVVFWNRQIDRYLANNVVSDDLNSHILKLRQFITVDLYNTLGTPKTTAYVNQFTQDWFLAPVATNRFSGKDLLQIATLAGAGQNTNTASKLGHPRNLDDVPTISTIEDANSSVTCNCSYNIYCSLTYNNSCSTNIHCNSVDYNCGISGGDKCSGSCQN